MKLVIGLVLLLVLSACSDEIPTTQFQEWGEYSFRLESRPPKVEVGMNEFLLIGNFKKKFRAYDLIVYYRIGPTGKWNQAIQDGHSGVYRKALRVSDIDTDVLYVRIKQSKLVKMSESDVVLDNEVFLFPLNYTSSSSSKPGE